MALNNPLSGVDKLLGFLGLGKTAGNVNLATMAPALGRGADQANQQITNNSAKQRQLLQRAKTTTDPKEKSRLLQESRLLDASTAQSGNSIGDLADLTKERGNVSDNDLKMNNLDFALKRGGQQSAELGSYAVPFGKAVKGGGLLANVLSKAVVPGAVSAGLQGAAKDDASLESIRQEALGGALGGGLLHGAGSLASKGLGVLGKASGVTALKSLRPSPSQVTKFTEKTGEDLAQFATRNKLFGKGTDQVNGLIKPLQESFNEIANKEGVNVSAQSLREKFAPLMAEFKGATQKELQSKGAKIEEAVGALVKKYGDNIPLSELTKERKLFDKLTGSFGRDAVDAETNQVMRDTIQDIIQGATEGVKGEGGRSLKELGQELNKMYSFKDIAKKQANLGRGSLPLGLTNSLGVGAGLASGFNGEGYDVKRGLQNAAIGGIAPAVANNPQLLKILSQGMAKAGNVAETKVPQLLQNALGQVASRTGGNVASPLVEDQPVEEQNQGEVPPPTPDNIQDEEQQTDNQGSPSDQLKQFNVPDKNIQEFMQFAQSQGINVGGQQAPQQGQYLNPYGKSPEELYQESYKALAAGDKKTAAMLQGMYEDETKYQEKQAKTGKGKLTSVQQTALADLDISSELISDAGTTIDSYKGLMGPVKGRAAQNNPYNTDAQAFEAEMLGLAQVVGKGLEGGKLGEGDISRYRKLLPQITDTSEVAKRKIEKVKGLITKQKTIRSKAYSSSTVPEEDMSEEDQMLQLLASQGLNLQ